MGRWLVLVRVVLVLIIVGLIVTLTGCSSSGPTKATSFPVPANIGLAPATAVSLDTGSTTQTFTATPRDTANAAVTTPVTFLSSNTAVLTVASNGNACAGTWDSLTTPADLYSGSGGSGPSDCHGRGRQQPTHHRVRASAHRQNRGEPDSGPDAAPRPLFFQGPNIQLPGRPPSAAVWISRPASDPSPGKRFRPTWQSSRPRPTPRR